MAALPKLDFEGLSGTATTGQAGVISVSGTGATYSDVNPIAGARSLVFSGSFGAVDYAVPNQTGFAVSFLYRRDLWDGAGADSILELPDQTQASHTVRARVHPDGTFDLALNFTRIQTTGVQCVIGQVYSVDVIFSRTSGTSTVVLRVWNRDRSTLLGSTTWSGTQLANPSALRTTCNTGSGHTYDDMVPYDTAEVEEPAPAGPTLDHVWMGAPSTTGFQVVAKVTAGADVRLAHSTDPAMAGATLGSVVTADTAGYARLEATGLTAGTTYHYQVCDDAGEPLAAAGRAKTLPPAGAAAFTVAIGSCTLFGKQDGAAHNSIRAWNPDFMLHLGDFYYTGSETTDPAFYRGLYEQMIQDYPGHADLCRDVPMFYTPSDHEAGPDNGDSNNAWWAAHLAVYNQVVPSRPADTRAPVVGRYQAWTAGRVRFILLDVRTAERSPGLAADGASKTMLGATQKQWLKDQLVRPEPLKIIVSDVGWMGPAGTSNGEDKWWSYATERQELIDYVAANDVQCEVWHGDSHSVAVKGKNNPYGGFPVLCASPMAQTGGGRNLGEFDAYWSNGGGEARQYMRVTFTDDGDTITRTASGWDAANGVERVSSVETYSTVPPVIPLIVGGRRAVDVLMGDGRRAVAMGWVVDGQLQAIHTF